MWCISDSYKTFIIDTFAHFAQKKIYRPLFQKTDFVALIRPHRVYLDPPILSVYIEIMLGPMP